MAMLLMCPRCAAVVESGEMRCYDYRIGWMCIHCEGELRGKVLLRGEIAADLRF